MLVERSLIGPLILCSDSPILSGSTSQPYTENLNSVLVLVLGYSVQGILPGYKSVQRCKSSDNP